MAENKKRFRIEFTVDMDCWGNKDIEKFALQELTCMSPYPEDIIFSEVGSNWHTGTPTEEGDYLVAVSYFPMLGVDYQINRFLLEPYNGFIYQLAGEGGKIVAWQKIEPYKENE